MGSTPTETEIKLEKHLKLLKEEYTKLQKSYAELELKYSRAALAANPDGGEYSSFISRLAMQVAGLYERDTFSDIEIKLADRSVPGHKFVLAARSATEWAENVITNQTVIDWSDLEVDVGHSLLRWIYTDVIDLQNDALALGLLRAAHRFKLAGLLGLCERALVSSVGVRSCVRFYCVAEEVGANTLQEYCSTLISSHWDDLSTQDFEHMSSPLLFKMLKSKTKQPLHAAVRLLREDVVFLCLVENETSVSDMVNSLSPQGHLPLYLALSAKNRTIADTLVTTGKANVNARNGEDNPLLIDAIKRGDAFVANFLLEKSCDVNVTAKTTGDTALHLICSNNCADVQSEDGGNELAEIGTLMVTTRSANINIQNVDGRTPLHLAIMAGNEAMINLLLQQPFVDVDVRTKEEQCALEIALMPPSYSSPPYDLAKRLLTEHSVCPNPIYEPDNESLIQLLCKRNLEAACVFLVDYDPMLGHRNGGGETILHCAAARGMVELTRILLQRLDNEAKNCQNVVDGNTALHLVVLENHMELLGLFVEQDSVNFNIRNSNGESPLKIALNMSRLEMIPLLVKGGANLNERNEDTQMTLLHETIINEDIEMALFLLKQGADINILTANEETALQLAIHCRLPKVVDALCSHGVLLSAGEQGDYPLWSALESGETEIAEILVKHGVDPDCWSPTGPNGCLQTLLHRAIDEHKESLAIFLIKNGCDLDSPRQMGEDGQGEEEVRGKATPLHMCAQLGLNKVFKKLLDHGANANAVEIDLKTPLHVATENQHNEIVEMLLYHGNIDLKVRDKNGHSAFAAAVTVRNHKAAKCILDRFPNAAEQIDQRGRNFLHTAIMKNDLESVLFLLSIHVDVNSRVQDVNQATPLHLAASSEEEMLVRTLILAGSLVNERDSTSRTPLHIAVAKNRPQNVAALLQNGADFDATDPEGNNALHMAVKEGHLPIVRELLTESGISAEAANMHGRNPLHELCRSGQDNVAVAICELFIECMPQYPINQPDAMGNTPLLLAFMRGQSGLCKVLVKNGACLGAENREGVTIFNYQLATNQLLHKLLDQLAKESPWTTTEMCQECGEKFSLIMRKHHCRHCGRNLCSKCSNNEVPIIKFQINKPVRVCTICFEVLQIGSD